ncbi:hypothetical protein KYTH63_15140 [Helicobacter pylori]
MNKKIAYLGDEKPITIWTSLDNVTVIQLEKDETISYITTGFNKGWSIVPNSNHIFIQPKSVKSNLMFEKEAVNFALMTRDYQEFLKTKKLIVDAPDPKELEEQKKALEKEKEANFALWCFGIIGIQFDHNALCCYTEHQSRGTGYRFNYCEFDHPIYFKRFHRDDY